MKWNASIKHHDKFGLGAPDTLGDPQLGPVESMPARTSWSEPGSVEPLRGGNIARTHLFVASLLCQDLNRARYPFLGCRHTWDNLPPATNEQICMHRRTTTEPSTVIDGHLTETSVLNIHRTAHFATLSKNLFKFHWQGAERNHRAHASRISNAHAGRRKNPYAIGIPENLTIKKPTAYNVIYLIRVSQREIWNCSIPDIKWGERTRVEKLTINRSNDPRFLAPSKNSSDERPE
ncbi:C4b-binding protein alpha chain-like protein [Anopheles sinensis]|uniref:C4b-binding protein alpha chain-like protein n=1 Tax=Anopheles sinensis TaxID=74873 RepID=A0A084WU27_ANOSI|nr:C4b-binding protein alpha chain-like protein [Anopheles sinensis]